MKKLSTKFNFVICFPMVTGQPTKIVIYANSDNTRGKVFSLAKVNVEPFISFMKSLTDQQCQDYMKTARDLTSLEIDYIVKSFDLIYMVGNVYRSSDYCFFEERQDG